jgi:glutaminyl-peptide cyclotransferase
MNKYPLSPTVGQLPVQIGAAKRLLSRVALRFKRPCSVWYVIITAVFAFPFLPIACRSDGPSAVHMAAASQPTVPDFDAEDSFDMLKEQCAFGPRVPNTVGHERGKEYIVNTLKPYVDQVVSQNFTYHDSSRDVTLNLTNILGIINPGGSDKILLCAHWDTRPTADEDFDVANRSKPIPGADDGASGVAVLLELAKVFHKTKPKAEVILAFWDAEDWGPDDPHMYIGAHYFSEHPGDLKPTKAVLIDMIGNKGVTVPREQYSEQKEPALMDEFYADAQSLGYSQQFPNTAGQEITDDHWPMIEAGIPTIDLIDFNYAYWHTLQDTPDKCSPDSLNIIGRTLELFVYDQPA